VIRGLYSAAGGMQANSVQQDVTAHNLSHAMKPGYRREVLRFDAVGSHDDIVGPSSSLHTDFSSGTLEQTGGTLDFALNGPGFFAVQGPSGPLYTRNGVFQLNVQGQIVTPDGLAVQGASGPIALPQEASSIEILGDGTLIADGNEIDKLRVVAFQNPDDLQRVGSTYFQAPPDSIPSAIQTEVRQGYREISNTSVVHEMVQMISGVRLFEATQRALRQLSDTIGLNTRPH
jgi:flagellar basal-body rod protein FlgF